MRRYTMSKRNWIVPKGRSYVIDTKAPAGWSEQDHYGGHLVAESIFREDELALILAAPEQAKRIAELEEQVKSFADFNAPILRIAEEEEPRAWDHLQEANDDMTVELAVILVEKDRYIAVLEEQVARLTKQLRRFRGGGPR